MIKFGGTSVGEGAAFVRAAGIAAEAAKNGPVAVVVSAMAGTTDALLALARTTSTGAGHDGTLAELHRSLADRHLLAAREAVPEGFLPEVEERLLAILGRLTEAASAPVDNPKAHRDGIASFGERLSAEVLAGTISSLGASASVVAGDPIATNGNFGGAEVLAGETRRRVGKYARPLLEAGLVVVVPGYIGRAPGGAVTTLGRGGSDLSATVLGRALGAEEVWILSDVDGVLDADPRVIPDAGLIPHLSYREAAQFSALGAEILHPRTTGPAAAAGIEVRVRSTFNPSSPGTRISGREGGPGVRSVALRRGLSLHEEPGVGENTTTPYSRERSDPLPTPGQEDGTQDWTGSNVFCALGADERGLKVLTEAEQDGDVAAVVCIGSPTDGDLLAGLRCLHGAGIRPLFAGNTSTGLLFAVAEGSAGGALRALHAGLILEASRGGAVDEIEPAKEVA